MSWNKIVDFKYIFQLVKKKRKKKKRQMIPEKRICSQQKIHQKSTAEIDSWNHFDDNYDDADKMKPCLWKKEKGLSFHEKDHSWLLYFFVCWLTIQCMCQINTFFQMIVCLFVWIKADFIFQIAVFQFYKCKKKDLFTLNINILSWIQRIQSCQLYLFKKISTYIQCWKK